VSAATPVLVTGATGAIGRALLGRLAGRGDAVRVLTRRERSGPPPAGRWVVGELREAGSLERACAGAGAVVHLAAVTHAVRAADYEEINVRGTERLAVAARAAGVERFVHVSSRALGEAGGAYAASKARAEAVVDAALPSRVVCRPAEVYGGDGDDPITSLARDVRRRALVPVLGDGRHELAPVHVDDVAGALAAALEVPRAAGRTYVLAGPESISYLELVGRLERLLGVSPRRRVHVPAGLARVAIALAARLGIGPYVPDQVPRLLLAKDADIGPAARDLGFAPRPLEVGLAPALARGAL